MIISVLCFYNRTSHNNQFYRTKIKITKMLKCDKSK